MSFLISRKYQPKVAFCFKCKITILRNRSFHDFTAQLFYGTGLRLITQPKAVIRLKAKAACLVNKQISDAIPGTAFRNAANV